jgi:ATP-dependent DNA helicase RecG
LGAQTLHEEIEAAGRAIATIARYEGSAPATSRPAPEVEAQASRGLERILACELPVDLRRRFEKLRKRLEARQPDAPRPDIGRDLSQLIDPILSPGWAETLLAQSLTALSGVGPKRAEGFARRGLERISDLLFWLPSRYEDRRQVSRVADLVVGRSATFVAEVQIVDWVPTRRGGRFGKIFQAVVGDAAAVVTLKWFRGGEALAGQVVKGRWLLVSGEVKRYRFSKELIHPEIEVVAAPQQGSLEAVASRESVHARVVPVYSAPEGMNPRTFRRLVGQAADAYADLVVGHLPPSLVAERRLPAVSDSLRALHRPESDIDIDAYQRFASPAHERLVLEELYLLELGLAMRRLQAGSRPGVAIDAARPESRSAAKALPFELTLAQRRVVKEILDDLAQPHPMNRLLQGDVGSGKTVVAVLAAVAVAACGGQTALMAPTELLAEQHFRTLKSLAKAAGDEMPLRIGLLTASLPRAEIQALHGALATGEIDLVVGTHALLQGEVEFRDLVLSIVDEQHRFGVMQRAALSAARPDGRFPHRLVMTATPIPRSLAMTVYGELDLSVLDELPPGRKPVETILLRAGEGRRVMELIRDTLGRNEQVYVVYPLVEESEKMDLRSATLSREAIARAFPEHRVDLVHGQLDAAARQQAMQDFGSGEASILVATTVIEVGVDVPNATLMVIEHAERFGLAQLHQLRGRVGRGQRGGRCVLVARGSSEKSELRLRALIGTQDGFAIADADLEIRGPGDFLGTRQSGHLAELRIADLLRDTALVAVARGVARAEIDRDPGLSRVPGTLRAVRKRWGKRIDLSSVG